MNIVLALAFAGAVADQPAEMTSHATAFVDALLDSAGIAAPPYASSAIKYVVSGDAKYAGRELPVISPALSGFRQALKGCSVGQALFQDGSSDKKNRVYVILNCPNDLAHANNDLSIILTIDGGTFVEAQLQVGPAVPVTFAPGKS